MKTKCVSCGRFAVFVMCDKCCEWFREMATKDAQKPLDKRADRA